MSEPTPGDRAASAQVSTVRLEAQCAVLRALAESGTLAEATPRLLHAIAEGLGWQHGAVWRVDRRANVLRCVENWCGTAATGNEFAAMCRSTTFAQGIGLPGRVWATARPVWVPDVLTDSNFPRAAAAAKDGLRGALGVPILARNGEVLGVIEFFHPEAREPDPDLLRTMAGIGEQIGRFVERRRSDEELEQLFSLSRDMLCIASFDGTFKRVNQAWERVLGWSREELTGRPYLDFVHPEDRVRTTTEASRLATGTETVHFENRYQCRDGSYRWLAWSATPAGQRRVIYAVARDIIDRIAAAAE